MSKSKVEIPSSELTSTDFEPRDLILEVDEDIPTDDVSISSKTGNKTEGDYQQWLKSLKLSVHEEKIQSQNNPMKRVHDENDELSKNSSTSASIIAEPRSKLIKVELNNQLEDTPFSNKTEFKCSRCDITVQSKERLKRH